MRRLISILLPSRWLLMATILLAPVWPTLAQDPVPDSQRSRDQDTPQVRPDVPISRPDLSRPPRTEPPAQEKLKLPDIARPSKPDAPAPTPTPPAPDKPRLPDVARPARPDIQRPVRPEGPNQPQPDAPRRPLIDVGRPYKPDISRPPRPDVARPPTPSVPRPNTPESDQPQAPELPAPPRPVSRVEITALAIIATNADNRIDPALRDLAQQLKPTFRFSGYRLAQSDTKSTAPGQPAVLRLIGSYSLQVTPIQATDAHVVLNVQAIQAGRLVLGLQLRLRPGMYQLIGGWPVSGNVLLAAISARPVD